MKPRILDIEEFRHGMCKLLHVRYDELFGDGTGRAEERIVEKRFAIVLALRRRTIDGRALSYPRIGRIMNRDHSTMLDARRRAEKMRVDPAFETMFQAVDRALNQDTDEANEEFSWQLDMIGAPVPAHMTPPIVSRRDDCNG